MVSTTRHGHEIRLVLSPNCSASWRQCRDFLGLMAATMAMVVCAAWFAGAPLVTPFAGLEFLLLYVCMRHVCRQCRRKQVIRVLPDRVWVESGFHRAERRWHLERPDAHLHVSLPEHPLGNMELVLAGTAQRLPVGGFLNQEDRDRVRRELRAAGLMETRNRWWESAKMPLRRAL